VLLRRPGTTTRDAALVAASRVTAVSAVVAAVGALPWLTGTDPAYTILRARAGEQIATEDALRRIRDELDLAPTPTAHLTGWLADLVSGDLGTSWVSGAPVLPGLLDALGVSLTLMGFALLVALPLAAAVAAPALRAALRGSPRRSGTAAAALTALPEFLLATALVVATVLVASTGLDTLPPYGWDGPHNAVLPALALGVPAGGYLGGLAADALAGCGREDWTATWAAAGFPRYRRAAALIRRALPALIPQAGLVVVGLTAGAVAVERVFAVPGLGRTTLAAAQAQDLPVVQGGVLVLLALGSVVGAAASVARLVVLGPALRTASLPAAPPPATRPCGRLVAAASAVLLGTLVVAGLPRDPYATSFGRLAAPGPGIPLGADASGRDLLARIGHGAAATIGTAALITVGCLVVGVLVGLLPRLSTGPVEVANALPPIVVGLVVAALAGPTGTGAAIAVLLVSWAPLAAHTSALVAEVKARPCVQILPVLGTGPVRALRRHVLPVVVPTIARHAVLRLPGVALALASLGFLGLGAQPPEPTWGLVLAEGIPYVERAPWAVLAPTISLVALAVLAVTLAAGSITLRPRPR
jgi:peptide/nickel transport system permease protein